jgi:hypothetical protein
VFDVGVVVDILVDVVQAATWFGVVVVAVDILVAVAQEAAS